MATKQNTDVEHNIKLEMNFKRDSSGTWCFDIQRPSNNSLSILMGCILGQGKDTIHFKGHIKEMAYAYNTTTTGMLGNCRAEWVRKIYGAKFLTEKALDLYYLLTSSIDLDFDASYINIGKPFNARSHLMNMKFICKIRDRISDPQPDEDGESKTDDNLLFNIRSGPHSAISENGQTAFAFGNDLSKMWVMTNRTLQVDELFEVKLKKEVVKFETLCESQTKYNAYGHPIAVKTPIFCIGMTAVNPAVHADNMGKRPDGWYWSGGEIYKNDTVVKTLGKEAPQVGDRVGILQDASGKLHFFLNGVDQRVDYNEKLPFPLYGAIQFGKLLSTATIMDVISTYGYLLKLKAEKQ